MTTHSSAGMRQETPHETETTKTPISDGLRGRAQSVINDSSIDPQWRTIIRYALELDDPWLSGLVRRAEAGENIVDTFESLRTLETNEHDSTEDRIKALAEIICRAGDEPHIKSAALLVLMATIEDAAHPKAVANAAKHLAFNRCGELNVYGMVDAQTARIEGELFRADTLAA